MFKIKRLVPLTHLQGRSKPEALVEFTTSAATSCESSPEPTIFQTAEQRKLANL